MNAQLKAQLTQGELAPESMPELVAITDAWFMAEPSVPVFVLRAIFRELANRWDDSQAVPTADHLPFKARLLPQLLSFLDRGNDSTALASLLTTFRDCRRDATPPPT